jgi:hypothetical protein
MKRLSRPQLLSMKCQICIGAEVHDMNGKERCSGKVKFSRTKMDQNIIPLKKL